MSEFEYPALDDKLWPTLGPQVCDFIEEELCHGPGDLLGQDVKLDLEQRRWIYRMYEVEPPVLERRKRRVIVRERNPRAGKRRFQRCALSLRKGSNKTELAAWIAAAELHADGPVRCDGFRGKEPVGCGVIDPYIPMIASTEEQTEELAYGALRRILEESDLGKDFDIGLERIMRLDGRGKAEAVSASPKARDGARTTFQHADETHLFTLEGKRRAWAVMLANLAKRPLADPWALETTTAPEPGAGSVAEATMQHAQTLAAKGDLKARLWFFHRQASEQHNLRTEAGLRAAIVEASGRFVGEWTDVNRIVAQWQDPDADPAYLERVWLNRPIQASSKAFDVTRWRRLRKETTVPAGAAITVGFDGGQFDDATAIVATACETGYQWVAGIWEKPANAQHWKVPVAEVDGAIADLFERYDVVRMYADPPKWETWVATWAGRYGDDRVTEWWTNRRKPMAFAIRAFLDAIAAGELCHDGSPALERHLGNSCRLYTNLVDEFGQKLWILRKERPDSPDKIDLAMAAILSWEAYRDAVAAGALASGSWRWRPL